MAEVERLRASAAREADWKEWGPYTADRAWGTVREDYSPDGDAWSFFSHDQARSRAYRWNEDGLGGFCNRFQNTCLSVGLWNEKDPILKERLFGLTGPEGNHGEDVKELYFHSDGVPSHAWMKMVYKYPHAEFPYADLVARNGARTHDDPEYEIGDAMPDTWAERAYFDVEIAYCKSGPSDVFQIITVTNMSHSQDAPIHVIPQIYHRNVWSWNSHNAKPEADASTLLLGDDDDGDDNSDSDESDAEIEISDNVVREQWERGCEGSHSAASRVKPQLRYSRSRQGVLAIHKHLGKREYFVGVREDGEDEIRRVEDEDAYLFCDNESNHPKLFGVPQPEGSSAFPKDAFHEWVVDGNQDAVNPERKGTKGGVHVTRVLPPGGTIQVWTRFCPEGVVERGEDPFGGADQVLAQRVEEADAFHRGLLEEWTGGAPEVVSEDRARIVRQAIAGMLWTKQYYHYSVDLWLRGDELQVPPPETRRNGRNAGWTHFYASDVIAMPDGWEYPWVAAWDLAFHTMSLALFDIEWAKRQITLVHREWYMSPSGAVPAYEWNFSDVNPPVMGMAALCVYRTEFERFGVRDTVWLESIFHKLLLSFTEWTCRKDPEENNVFEGGFLGLDNVSVLDRSAPLPPGAKLLQSDATAWTAAMCLHLLQIAIELALHASPAYEESALKFLEHFVLICNAATTMGGQSGLSLWCGEDGFFYDMLSLEGRGVVPLRIRSVVGLIPLLAVTTISRDALRALPRFSRRVHWFLKYRRTQLEALPEFANFEEDGGLFLSMVSRTQLDSIMGYMLDEDEFLSPHGIRSLSKYHEGAPFDLQLGGECLQVGYTPGESRSGMFGGNSSWRGAVWAPTHYAIVTALRSHAEHYGPSEVWEYPTRSGTYLPLNEIADRLAERFLGLWEGEDRPITSSFASPCFGDEGFAEHLLFYEYMDGDTGRGCGASHQTGWTALAINLVRQVADSSAASSSSEAEAAAAPS